jgi:hypothetical protein
MQEAVSLPSQPQALSFSAFLTALFQALENEGIRPCILRNYEGFPIENVGSDVDFLIRPSELPRAIRALRSIQGIRIVGYSERPYVASSYLAGTSAIPGGRSLQIDFDLSLSWKGLPYLPIDSVLHAAITRRAGNLNFVVPSAVHEAITSLLASLLVAGWIKEKYFAQVRQIFADNESQVIAALSPQFGRSAASRLVNSVIDGDRRSVLDCVPSLRVSLVLRSFLHRPLRTVLAIVRHYAKECAIRFSPTSLETVCILGSNGCDKTATIEALMPILQSSAKVVGKYHPESCLPIEHESTEITATSDSRAQTSSGSFVSMVRVVRWLVDDWRSQFFGKMNLTLRISEICSYQLVVDPQACRYEGPAWFACIVHKLFPSPSLWILLDLTSRNSRSTGRQLPPAGTLRHIEAYRAFVTTRKKYVILDASQPPDRITESAYAAIIDTLAERAHRKLKNRFQQRNNSN